MEIYCPNHSVCPKEHFGCTNICIQELGSVNAGMITGVMFFMREAERLKGVKTVYNLIDLVNEWQVPFRDVDSEMLFKSELHHTRYYPVGDFENLCFKCFDFSKLIQKPAKERTAEYRGIPRGPFPKTHR